MSSSGTQEAVNDDEDLRSVQVIVYIPQLIWLESDMRWQSLCRFREQHMLHFTRTIPHYRRSSMLQLDRQSVNRELDLELHSRDKSIHHSEKKYKLVVKIKPAIHSLRMRAFTN